MAANSILAKMQVVIDANTAQFNKSLSQSTSQFQKFSSNISTIGKSLVAGFGLLEIGRGVIEVTSQFEKFEAILTNTLGDSSKAQKALADIREFAQVTPFEVSEITAAYVRWANQGLNPTIDRMRKLGDVASSLGAGFEQTAEAVKDLMVGQT
jgi:phage tail tape-measure protein